VAIYEQDGLEPLIRLLGSSDPDVQKNSIETISLMLQVLLFDNLHCRLINKQKRMKGMSFNLPFFKVMKYIQ